MLTFKKLRWRRCSMLFVDALAGTLLCPEFNQIRSCDVRCFMLAADSLPSERHLQALTGRGRVRLWLWFNVITSRQISVGITVRYFVSYLSGSCWIDPTSVSMPWSLRSRHSSEEHSSNPLQTILLGCNKSTQNHLLTFLLSLLGLLCFTDVEHLTDINDVKISCRCRWTVVWCDRSRWSRLGWIYYLFEQIHRMR